MSLVKTLISSYCPFTQKRLDWMNLHRVCNKYLMCKDENNPILRVYKQHGWSEQVHGAESIHFDAKIAGIFALQRCSSCYTCKTGIVSKVKLYRKGTVSRELFLAKDRRRIFNFITVSL